MDQIQAYENLKSKRTSKNPYYTVVYIGMYLQIRDIQYLKVYFLVKVLLY